VEHYAEGLPRVPLDGAEMERAIRNIIVNAQEAMADTGGTLRIETEAGSDGHYLIATISDTGPGITPEILKDIFEPFFTTKGSKEKCGLGLCVARSIIEAHRGTLSAQSSRSARGTMFVLALPAAPEFVAEEPHPTSKAVEAQPVRAPTVLVVESDEDLREILRETLQTFGYTVQTVRDSSGALSILSTNGIDLILLDIQRPGAKAFSVVSELRSRFSALPLIILAGPVSEEEIEETRKLGVCSCLCKPFEIRQLLAEVKAAVRY
jgi:CheY-like chemotaxis protein